MNMHPAHSQHLHHICLPTPLFLWVLGELSNTVREASGAICVFMFHINWYQLETSSSSLRGGQLKSSISTFVSFKYCGTKLVQSSLVLPLEEGRCPGISDCSCHHCHCTLLPHGIGTDASSPLSTQSCTSESKQSSDEASLVLQEKTIAFYVYPL